MKMEKQRINEHIYDGFEVHIIQITGNKYKFGLYFNNSCTTAENPLCAALNNGVAPS